MVGKIGYRTKSCSVLISKSACSERIALFAELETPLMLDRLHSLM